MQKIARCTIISGERKTITSLNSRAISASCNGFGLPLESVCPSRARPNKVSSIWPKSLTARHVDAHARVSVARIPPVVPDIQLDSRGLSLAESARLSAPLHGQFTFKNGETLD